MHICRARERGPFVGHEGGEFAGVIVFLGIGYDPLPNRLGDFGVIETRQWFAADNGTRNCSKGLCTLALLDHLRDRCVIEGTAFLQQQRRRAHHFRVVGHHKEIQRLLELRFRTTHVAHRLTAGKAVTVFGPGFLVTQAKGIDGPVGVAVCSTEENIFFGIDGNLVGRQGNAGATGQQSGQDQGDQFFCFHFRFSCCY